MMHRSLTLPVLFAGSSGVSVLCGAAILATSGLSFETWARNPVAWVAGALLALVIPRLRQTATVNYAILAVALLGTGFTLVARSTDGVHRWLDLGPLHINMAALLLPPAVVALGRVGVSNIPGIAWAFAMSALFVVQPDGSQATALLVALVVLAFHERMPAVKRVAVIGVTAVATIAAWLRPDPLQPIAEAEQIFALGAEVSMPLAVIAGMALAACCLTPLVAARDGRSRSAGLALGGYFVTTALAPFVGVFPVPMVGLGMSFPLGFWLGVGYLNAAQPLAARSDGRRGTS